ncbi:hypothetical protein ACMBCN_02010 [Candidatus Liberibacter asiaticus]|nr:hypothetical protein [Candidatus Liberibacter asiaticus]
MQTGVVVESTRELEDSPYKRKYRTWGFECLLELESKSSSSSSSCCREEEEVDGDRTLELFPLHPEGRS